MRRPIKTAPGECLDFIDLVLGAQAFNVAFDLHLSLRKRIGVMAIFAVGAFTIIIAIIRLAVISSEVLEYGLTLPDVTWFTSKFSWTVIDPAVGCFVACMPIYSPLVKPLRHFRDCVSLVGVSWTRVTRSSNASRKGTTKIEDSNVDNFYLANCKPAGTREVTVARKSSSTNSRQELHPVPGTATAKRDFTREDHREKSW
ncbi:putative integral membrane protein [Botrytis fragariae]|uniref:Putative integral membrane protein n=1 Tax=Botrytis fragariae TaxID=1964551 RepID=A0A8H6EMH1_9HELO|nr:putative integral membrane protein [Botrytis fragariae]KAF5877652.1 putative integral membrane protein [Botrytis fragariae]